MSEACIRIIEHNLDMKKVREVRGIISEKRTPIEEESLKKNGDLELDDLDKPMKKLKR